MNSLLKSAGIALAVTFGASSAMAESSSASFIVTGFSYSVIGGGTLSWDMGGSQQSLDVQSQSNGGLGEFSNDSSNGMSFSDVTLSSSTGKSSATASSTTLQNLSGLATSTNGGNNFIFSNSGLADAMQSGQFTLSQAGSVTFSFTYSLSAAGTSANTYGLSSLSFSAGSFANTSGGLLTRSLTSIGSAGSANDSGTLSLTVVVDDAFSGGSYSLTGNASALASAVPEPSEWAMLMAGLIGVGVIARRRANAKA